MLRGTCQRLNGVFSCGWRQYDLPLGLPPKEGETSEWSPRRFSVLFPHPHHRVSPGVGTPTSWSGISVDVDPVSPTAPQSPSPVPLNDFVEGLAVEVGDGGVGGGVADGEEDVRTLVGRTV